MIQFYKHRWKYYILSLAIIALGIVMMFVEGVTLDVEFKGGSIIKYVYEGTLDTGDVDALVTETLDRDVVIQVTTSRLGTGEVIQKLALTFSGQEGLSEDAQIALDTALKTKYPDANFSASDTRNVKPLIGERFLRTSLFALLLATVLMILYIWYSFRKVSGLSAGVMSMVALLHDVAIAFFVFVIFKMPINESFIAVALTILGYSLNDTIVIFDRVRENKRIYGAKLSADELVTKSINQSLTRSINTGLATFVSIVVVYIFAAIYDIESIRSFALPMAFGIISGCYSTVCLVGPLWATWQNFKDKSKGKAKIA